MMEILKGFVMVFVFAVGCVFGLVGLTFLAITWLFGKCGESLCELAVGIGNDAETEGEELPSEEVPT